MSLRLTPQDEIAVWGVPSWSGRRRDNMVPRVRFESDAGASGTPHCCFEHIEQSREHEAPPDARHTTRRRDLWNGCWSGAQDWTSTRRPWRRAYGYRVPAASEATTCTRSARRPQTSWPWATGSPRMRSPTSRWRAPACTGRVIRAAPAPTQDESEPRYTRSGIGPGAGRDWNGAPKLAWKMTRVVVRHRTLLRPRQWAARWGNSFDGDHLPADAEGGSSWRCSTRAVAGWMCTRPRWSPVCGAPGRAGAARARCAPLARRRPSSCAWRTG